ncbi:MAG: fatty acid hydroxylase [Ferruginibacter sp.]|nr:fatty acid hydroxylase [Ferruginibacter sp.]
MHIEKIKNKGQARLFSNNYLEFLTKTHPLVIWCLYLPIILWLPYYSVYSLSLPTESTIIFFIAGGFFWTLTEYVLHRFVFHHHPKTFTGKKINYLLHGNHHEYPRDKQRLFMPPLPSLLIASTFIIFFRLIIGKYAYAFFPGFMLGYLVYASMHYAIHAWKPPFKWMKSLWINHHLHHYKHESKGFGVSSTLWDHVFGTMFDVKKEKAD